MKESELRQLIREVVEEELLAEAKHVTGDPKKFRQWFPEISTKFFTNIKMAYLEIGSADGKTTFRYVPGGMDDKFPARF